MSGRGSLQVGPKLRDIVEYHWQETLKHLPVRAIRDTAHEDTLIASARHLMERLGQLWRLRDLRDGGGFGFKVELFFLSLRQLLSMSPSSDTFSTFHVGTLLRFGFGPARTLLRATSPMSSWNCWEMKVRWALTLTTRWKNLGTIGHGYTGRRTTICQEMRGGLSPEHEHRCHLYSFVRDKVHPIFNGTQCCHCQSESRFQVPIRRLGGHRLAIRKKVV